MLRFTRAVALAAAVAMIALLGPRAHAFGWPGNNDNIFPAAAAAKPYIDFDGRGFIIRGRRTFIVAGGLHYSRVPRALWRDRLLRIKRAGYNTVQTYAFWNYHEYKQGHYDFTGDRDFGAYLSLIHQLGMYAIVRVGPYVNAEWDSGGWPVWMRFQHGLSVRDSDPVFLTDLDRWLDHLMPIVSANQINHGGSVIMVQLENEDSRGAGTDIPNAYFQHLKDKCVSLGLQVPCFFSGLNHSDNPAGDTPFDISARTSPWYSTEFWTGWVAFYGADPDRTMRRIRATWNVIANGGAGYTHYTIAGGTDFETWGCDEQAAAYDFGAPIGQAGDLRPMYYGFKRAALFATSFPGILANASNSSAQYQGAATAQGVSVASRTSPVGTLVFLRNDSGAPVKTQFKIAGKAYPVAGPVSLDANETMPLVINAPLLPGVRLTLAAARILGTVTHGNETTIVVYGAAGDPAELHLQGTAGAGMVIYKESFPSGAPQLSTFHISGKIVRVLAESADLADHTWFVDAPDGQRDIVCGPDYVGDIASVGGRMVFQTERSDTDTAPPGPSFLLTPDGSLQALTQTARSQAAQATAHVPTLAGWHVARGDAPAQPGYDDHGWLNTGEPRAMGADGDIGAYAWYRTIVHAPKAGDYSLNFADAGDWITAFVGGKRVASSTVQQRFRDAVPRSLRVTLAAGDNSVAVFAAHYGREKLHAYIGPLDEIDAKGISGPVTLATDPTTTATVTQWRWKMDDRGPASAGDMADPKLSTTGSGWQDASIGQDVFQGHIGFAWFRTTLDPTPGERHLLHFGRIDDNATVYLNGKQLTHHDGWNSAFDVSLDGAWLAAGPNVLAVLVENTNGGGGILQDVTLTTMPGGSQTPIGGWKMRGGAFAPPDHDPAWSALGGAAAPGVPAFYRAQFTLAPPTSIGPHPILRVSPVGLSRGFVWLNGHSLGRYPEKSPVDGLYMPECWYRSGVNTLTIFDEEGQSPSAVKLIAEAVAGRSGMQLTPVTPQPRRASTTDASLHRP